MSQSIYQQLDLKPALHPTAEKIKGLYGPNHSPLGECSIKIKIPELAVAVNFDFIVDDIEVDMLIDAFMFSMPRSS